jgi:hypothetical protein
MQQKLVIEGEGEQAGKGGNEGEDDDDDDLGCSICFLPMVKGDGSEHEGDEAETLRCSHAFHVVCLEAWMSTCQQKKLQASCPMCRADLVRG